MRTPIAPSVRTLPEVVVDSEEPVAAEQVCPETLT
jgi:hypothetical protein